MWIRIIAGGSMAMCGALFVGLLMFGTELPSYLANAAGSVRSDLKESIPLEFELQRARDMLDDLMPEIHSKIQRVAQAEVEIKSLTNQIRRNELRLGHRAHKLQSMRKALEARLQSIDFVGDERQRQLQRLSVAFDQYKESEALLASQRGLLDARADSLRAARDALEDYRSQKALIEQKIQSLTTRHQLVQAQSELKSMSKNSNDLTRIDELLTDVEVRIDIASRILDYETDLLPSDATACLDEKDLLADVDQYLKSRIGTLKSEMIEVTSDDGSVRVID